MKRHVAHLLRNRVSLEFSNRECNFVQRMREATAQMKYMEPKERIAATKLENNEQQGKSP